MWILILLCTLWALPAYPQECGKSAPGISEEEKARFIERLLPLVIRANEEVLKEREFLLYISGKDHLNAQEKRRFKEIAEKYRTDDIKELLKRVDAVPVSIILAQAVIESGWGTSRFFKEGNNIFGIYTYTQRDCLKANAGSACLRRYPDLYQSVRDYIYNINVGWAYAEFRDARMKGADVFKLVELLEKYSSSRKEYVRLLKDVIRENDLTRFDTLLLSSSRKGSSRRR